jgi:hypothetical protein
MSTRNGAMPYSVGAQGIKARDRPLLFGGHLLHMPEAMDWWDACTEGLYMALMALDRIAQVLYNNFAEHAHLAGYQRLTQSISTMLKYAKASLPEATVLQDHCSRLIDMMAGIDSALEQLEEEPQELPESALYEPLETGEVEVGEGTDTPQRRRWVGLGSADSDVHTNFANSRQQLPKPLHPSSLVPQTVGGSANGAGQGVAHRNAPLPPGITGGGLESAATTGVGTGGAAGAPVGKLNSGPETGGTIAQQQGGLKKERTSSLVVSGSKGIGNLLGLRKKGGKPETASIHKMHEASEAKAGSAAAPDTAAKNGGQNIGAQAAKVSQPTGSASGPQTPPKGRGRHVFRAAPAAPTGALASPDNRRSVQGHAAAPSPGTPATPGAGPPSSQALAPLPSPSQPQPQRTLRYIGPLLEPLIKETQLAEGFPFGAPMSVTLNETVRCKRHIVFESQTTSSQQQIWEAYRDPSVRPDTSHTLAELLATIGTMPAPLQLARTIDSTAVLNDIGGAVLAVPGHFVEVTSGHEPVRVFARVEMDWPAMHLIATFRMQSMLESDISQMSARVQVLGAATWVGLSGWNVLSLSALQATTRTVRLAVTGSSALVLQLTVMFRTQLRPGDGVERLEVATVPLRVPVTLQLKAPRVPLTPSVFFQRFYSWHFSCTVSGMSPRPCTSYDP